MSEGSGSPQARMPVACNPCRKGKRKCDRMLPCCGYCAKTGRKCGVPDVLDLQSCSRQKRQRVPKGFVEILESKVKALEQSIQKQRAELESLSTQAEYSQPMGTGPANTPAATMSMDSGLAPHVRTANDLPSASGELQDHPSCPVSANTVVSLSRMNERSESGLFSTMSVIYAILSADGSDPISSSHLRSCFHPQSINSDQFAVPAMIEKFIIMEGVTFLATYKKAFHLRYPFLNIEVLTAKLTQCESDRNIQHLVNASPAERFQIFCVLAIGIVIEGHRISFATQIEGNLCLLALSHLEEIFKHSQSWDQVRTILLLAIYSMSRPSVGCTWHLIGLAVRISMGCEHNSCPSSDVPEPPISTKRAVLCTYMLEQMVCRALSRVSSLTGSEFPHQSSQTFTVASGEVEGDVWKYWVAHSQHLADSFTEPLCESSIMPLAHSISHLRSSQPANCSTEVQRLLDQEYLCDMVSLMLRNTAVASTTLEKYCLFVSIMLLRRLLHEEEPLVSWIKGMMVYRAGMLCLKSTRVLDRMSQNEELSAPLSETLDKCSQYLSRVCIDFKGLALHKSRFDAVLHLYAITKNGNHYSTGNMERQTTRVPLPIFEDEKIALQAAHSIQNRYHDSRASQPGLHRGMSRLVSCTRLESDQEIRLFHVLLATSE